MTRASYRHPAADRSLTCLMASQVDLSRSPSSAIQPRPPPSHRGGSGMFNSCLVPALSGLCKVSVRVVRVQGGPPGRSRRQHGALAAASAGAPAAAAPSAGRLARKAQNLGPPLTHSSRQSATLETVSRIWQLSGAGVLPTSVLSGSARTCQERLRRRLRRSSTLDRTCPTVLQLSGAGTRCAKAAYDMYPGAAVSPCGIHGLRPVPCRGIAPVSGAADAWYLTVILNSDVLTQLVRPLHGRGEHNSRNFDEYLFQLPIPLY